MLPGARGPAEAKHPAARCIELSGRSVKTVSFSTFCRRLCRLPPFPDRRTLCIRPPPPTVDCSSDRNGQEARLGLCLSWSSSLPRQPSSPARTVAFASGGLSISLDTRSRTKAPGHIPVRPAIRALHGGAFAFFLFFRLLFNFAAALSPHMKSATLVLPLQTRLPDTPPYPTPTLAKRQLLTVLRTHTETRLSDIYRFTRLQTGLLKQEPVQCAPPEPARIAPASGSAAMDSRPAAGA